MKYLYYTLLLCATFWLQTSCVDDPEIPPAIPERSISAKRSLDLKDALRDAERFIYASNGKAFFTTKSYNNKCYSLLIIDLESFEISKEPVALIVNDKEYGGLNELTTWLSSDTPFVVFGSNVLLISKNIANYAYLFDPYNLVWEQIDIQGDYPEESFWKDERCISSTTSLNKAYCSGPARDDNHTLVYEFNKLTYNWKKLTEYPASPYLCKLYSTNNSFHLFNERSFYLYSSENNSWLLDTERMYPFGPYSTINEIVPIGEKLYSVFYDGLLSYSSAGNEIEYIHLENGNILRSFVYHNKLYTISLFYDYSYYDVSYMLYEYQL